MTAAPNAGVLFTDCQHCDGTGCLNCRPFCRICELQHVLTLANLGGRYCDRHDPETAPIPL